MILFSPAFADGAELPSECAYDNENRSPTLQWKEAPLGVARFALLCEDPEGWDGKAWTHWLIWNIPAIETRLLSGQPAYPRLEDGSVQGINDYLELGWGGPCPPKGLRRYLFRLFALDAPVHPANPTRAAFDEALRGRIMAEASIEGIMGHDQRIGSYEALRHARKPVDQTARSE